MKDIHIPPTALEAGARAVFRVGYARDPFPGDVFDEGQMALARKYARAAFEAMVKAWPGVATYNDMNEPGDFLLLPLMEKPDDQA